MTAIGSSDGSSGYSPVTPYVCPTCHRCPTCGNYGTGWAVTWPQPTYTSATVTSTGPIVLDTNVLDANSGNQEAK